MADTKITDLAAETAPATDDLMEVVDVSDTTMSADGTNSKITLSTLMLAMYPVGAVYISVVSTSPATLFGGTWSAFGAGKVLVGLDSGDGDFDASEETGGVKDVTLTSAQSGVPAHNHPPLGSGKFQRNVSLSVATPGGGAGTDALDATTGNNTAANAASAHTNLQPYIVVYMWKRTA